MPQFRGIINIIDRLRDHQGAVVCWGFFFSFVWFFFCTATLHDWNNLLLYLVLILESEHFWYKITLGILNTFYVQVEARETGFRDPKAPWMSHISSVPRASHSHSTHKGRNLLQLLGSGASTQPAEWLPRSEWLYFPGWLPTCRAP